MGYIEGSTDGVLLSGTITAISAPLTGVRRIIRTIIVSNVDSRIQYLSIRLNNSGTYRTIWRGNLDPNESFNLGDTLVLDTPYKSITIMMTGNAQFSFPEYITSYGDVDY